MPSLTISDAVYERLSTRAAALNVTVEQLILPMLEFALESEARTAADPVAIELPVDDWKARFDAWMKDVRARAHRYPAGFVMNDSRESIYEGCGE